MYKILILENEKYYDKGIYECSNPYMDSDSREEYPCVDFLEDESINLDDSLVFLIKDGVLVDETSGLLDNCNIAYNFMFCNDSELEILSKYKISSEPLKREFDRLYNNMINSRNGI